jgi:hypothetical protein
MGPGAMTPERDIRTAVAMKASMPTEKQEFD